ncbi:lysophospholipid acyltransferase family protein [Marinicella gelatinilytica]|uniref:lysophospholipid acyltransferase family protein n=1 Tax=Marinicella gelatinilytica TaxID=2996017 RepID=UPI002260CC1F|nr:lysophospholipid acyltransferase family protein [Marinicella gelatinilytica]MCX7543932.1 lysophospholipid acyltransferase family protein [Marinicella gelatinilytica]
MTVVLKHVFQIYVWLFVYPVAWLWTALIAIIVIILTWLGAGAWADKYVARLWGRFILWITPVRVNIHNADVIDASQSYVIVANHQSTYDILALYGYLPMAFKWVMKIELRKVPFIGYTCNLMGHIYVDRSNRRAAKQTMQQAGEKLTGGTSVLFFPEGTRNNGHELLPFKKGAFKMAQSLSLPILPVTIKGADNVMPAKSLRILPGTIELFFHAPISPESFKEQSTESLIEHVRAQISKAL